jgi:hypothetical protein
MLTPNALRALDETWREHRVLSVFASNDTVDPTHRSDWRRALLHTLASMRSAWEHASHAEREALDAAIRHVTYAMQLVPVSQRFAGWAVYATEDGVRHAAILPRAVPMLSVWQNGLHLAPYLAAVPRRQNAALAMVDASHAALYALRGELLTALDTLDTRPLVDDVAHLGRPPRSGFHPGTRGVTGTDQAERARQTARSELLDRAADLLGVLSAPADWILVGGIPEDAKAVVARLPHAASLRARVVTGLDVHATPAQITERAHHEVLALQHEAEALELRDVLEDVEAGGRACAGQPATRDALRLGAVARLHLSPRYIAEHPDEADEAVRGAFACDADIACAHGENAERLDAQASGIAAQLRYVPSTWRGTTSRSASVA